MPDYIAPAIFSPDRMYRYTLHRRWRPPYDTPQRRMLQVIGLNPSTADEVEDDPTIRRCIGFAKSWGFASLVMTNLFAWRSTKPSALYHAEDPVGPHNDCWLKIVAEQADMILLAWGEEGHAVTWGSACRCGQRDAVVMAMLAQMISERILHFPGVFCLGTTKRIAPRHPLYVKKDCLPQSYPL